MRLLAPLLILAAATAAASEPTPQFVYVLKVEPPWHVEAARTDTERATVGAHFERLKVETEAGRVILADRTDEKLDTTFGLVIFKRPTRPQCVSS